MIQKKMLMTFLLASMSAISLAANEKEDADKALDSGDYKQAITLYQEAVVKAPKNQQGPLKAKIALSYYRDQEDEKAFKTYLEALVLAPVLSPPPVTQNEQTLYENALQLYLEHTGAAAHEIANTIRQDYCPVLALHSDYYLLNFIVAAAYANLGMFDEFFERFYRSYEYYPDSFMAYKTKAILNIKLYEKASIPSDRESYRQQIFTNAEKASQKNPLDVSLYKVMITFSKENEHQALLLNSMKKILNENIKIPRTDILFYVKELSAAKQPGLAQQFLDRATQWYQFSRTLQAAQELLDQNKK